MQENNVDVEYSEPEAEQENDYVEPESEQETDQETTETEKAPEVEENGPERYNQRINKKHRELMEERRQREAAEARIQELEAKQQQTQRPEIPPLPDPYDEDFDAQMHARDRKILEVARYDAQQAALNEQHQQQQLQRQQQEKQQLETLATTYAQRAAKLKISPAALKDAGETVAAIGIDQQIVEHILQDERGPLITKYLADNPDELERMQTMTPVRAAVYLETTVKGKINGGVRRVNVPEPPETLSGGGATKRERGPKGARYE